MSDCDIHKRLNSDHLLNFYSPVEIVNLFKKRFVDKNQEMEKKIFMKGIYRKSYNSKDYNGDFYDVLKDENFNVEITIIVNNQIRQKLSERNLVSVSGFLESRINNPSNFQIQLRVTGAVVIQEHTMNETEIKQSQIRIIKTKNGFKNVDAILENILYTDKRPQIGLLYAETTITDKDFFAGKETASHRIDFHEHKVSFANSEQFASMIHTLDKMNYDVIALIRGGGVGLEHVDNIKVLDAVAKMGTPVISAVGHDDDKLFLKNIVDKSVPVPHALGTFFKDIVERVGHSKNKSLSIMTEEVKKQFNGIIESQKTQISDLKKRLTDYDKQKEEDNKMINSFQKELILIRELLMKKEKNYENLNKENTQNVNEILFLKEQFEAKRRSLFTVHIIWLIIAVLMFIMAKIL